MDRIRVLVVDDSEETRSSISQMLMLEKGLDLIGESANGREAIEMSEVLRPNVILMDINMPVMDGLKATEEISLRFPDMAVIIMSVQAEIEYLQKAMSAGARDYIIKPFSFDDVIKTIKRTYEFVESRRKKRIEVIENTEKINTKIVTVFSTKGGVGKTTLATNIAVALQKTHKKKVAILDINLQLGDVAISMNISVRNTLSDMVREVSSLDRYTIKEFFTNHLSGVDVLAAPSKPEYAEFVSPDHIAKILDILKSQYHYIIIDTATGFNEINLLALDSSDFVLYVSTLDIVSLKNLKLGINVMKSLSYPDDKITFILNKSNLKLGITIQDFEKIINKKIEFQLPEDNNTAISSINKGIPFMLSKFDTKLSKGISKIIEEGIIKEKK